MDLNYNPVVANNNLETVSRNSKMSVTTSYKKRLNAIERCARFKNMDMPAPIDERDEIA